MNRFYPHIEGSNVLKEVFFEGTRYRFLWSRDQESGISFEMVQHAANRWKVLPPARTKIGL